MKQLFPLLLLIFSSFLVRATDTTFFKADHPYFQYTGRIDMSNPAAPRFWQPGVYIRVKFRGNCCKIVMDDQEQHNYLSIQIDARPVKRLKLTSTHNIINAADDLDNGEHILTICKDKLPESSYHLYKQPYGRCSV